MIVSVLLEYFGYIAHQFFLYALYLGVFTLISDVKNTVVKYMYLLSYLVSMLS